MNKRSEIGQISAQSGPSWEATCVHCVQSLHSALLVSCGDDNKARDTVACANADTNEQRDRYGYFIAFDKAGLAAALVKIDLQVRGGRREIAGSGENMRQEGQVVGLRGRRSVQRVTSASAEDSSACRSNSIPCFHTHDDR